MCFNEWENNCKKISSFRNYDSTEIKVTNKETTFILINFFLKVFLNITNDLYNSHQ